MKPKIVCIIKKEIERLRKIYDPPKAVTIIKDQASTEAFAELMDYNSINLTFRIYVNSIVDLIKKSNFEINDLTEFFKHIARHEYGHSLLTNTAQDKKNLLVDLKMAYLPNIRWAYFFKVFNEYHAENFAFETQAVFHPIYIDYKISIIAKCLQEIDDKKILFREKINYKLQTIEWVNSFYLFDKWELLSDRFSIKYSSILSDLKEICAKFHKIIKENNNTDKVLKELKNLAQILDH